LEGLGPHLLCARPDLGEEVVFEQLLGRIDEGLAPNVPARLPSARRLLRHLPLRTAQICDPQLNAWTATTLLLQGDLGPPAPIWIATARKWRRVQLRLDPVDSRIHVVEDRLTFG
jgi:hypothetical protein